MENGTPGCKLKWDSGCLLLCLLVEHKWATRLTETRYRWNTIVPISQKGVKVDKSLYLLRVLVCVQLLLLLVSPTPFSWLHSQSETEMPVMRRRNRPDLELWSASSGN